MNLGIAVHYFDRNEGTGGYVVELVRRLAHRHDVTIYAAAAREPVPDRVRFVRVPALRGRAYATMLTFPQALRAVRRRHDLLHAQGWVATDAEVVTAHIVLAAWREAAAAARVGAPLGERLLGGLVAGRERDLMRRARAVIAPSAQARADVLRLVDPRTTVAIVPHGCDRAIVLPERAEARRRQGIPPAAFTALYAGDARKGLATALEAVSRLADVHLAVLSPSPRGPWLARAAASGAAHRTHWLPAGTSIADGLALSDVLLHPTIYDTFALVVAEALHHGVPVVTSRQAGVAELLQHGRDAWLLDAPDGPATADALAALQASPPLRSRLADAGRAIASTWTWDRCARATEAVYEAARR